MELKLSNSISQDIREPLLEIFAETGIAICEGGKPLCLTKRSDGLIVHIKTDMVSIEYSRRCELFRAIGIVREHFHEDGFYIHENPAYRTLALMADNSRNAVNNTETFKKAVRILALMGYNMYMLYMEDVYEIPEHPYFGYMRGRYSRAEIKEMDDYARRFGIELVPAIQTLSHLNTIFKWPEFQAMHDIDDILLVGDESTYELIDCMLKSISGMFSAKRINIGMDEAFNLGRGKYFDVNGNQKKSEIMLAHLSKVLKLCKKYGLSPMIWSDMFTRSSEGCIASLPPDIAENVGLVYWDYVTADVESAVDALKIHKRLAKNVLFAGGAWRWEGYAPFMQYSYITSRRALKAVKQCGIDEVIVTAWGDGGGDASLFCVLPVYQMFAEACYRNDTTEEHVAKRLLACADAVMDDFTALELPNLPVPGEIGGGYETNPVRYLLFQDVLMGLYDRHVLLNDFAKHYEGLVPVYEQAVRRNPKWAYIFELMISLSRLLQYKCDIGIKLKNAYDAGDKEKLAGLIKTLNIIKERCEDFHNSVRIQWLKENKAFGLEVQDIRIGGVKARIDTAILRVDDYIKGNINNLEELDQERLYADGRKDPNGSPNTHSWFWRDVVTAGVIER